MAAEVTGTTIASAPSAQTWRQDRDGFPHIAVAGTPEEIGAQHGELLRSEIQDMLAALSHHVLNGKGGMLGQLVRPAILALARLMEPRIDARYKREMAALARAADASYSDVLLLNCLDDILANLRLPGEIFARWACSGFGTWSDASPTGDLLCGRNLDYYVWSADGEDPWVATNYMKAHVVTITYQPTDKPAFVSVGWPGFIGAPTALNANGVTVNALTVSTRWNWPFATPATFIYRDIAESAATLGDAIGILRRAARSQGNNVLLGSGAERRAVVVEFTPWKLSVREPTGNSIATTNHFQHSDTARASHYISPGSLARMQRLDHLASELEGREAAMECLLDTMKPADPQAADFPIYNACTIYSVLFEPARGRLWVRPADTPERAFQEVTLP
ncbi:MAG TPA: C45 family peptidase [Chloroflexota bacterium]